MKVFIYEHVSAGGLGPVLPSLQREGAAMLAALVEDFGRVPGVSVATAPTADSVKELAARSEMTLVIAPEFDRLLEEHSEAVLAAGGRLLGSSAVAVRLTADKLALAEFWQQRGVPTPATAPLTFHTPLPAVCKPRYGAGSLATVLARSRADWAAVTQDFDGPMIAQSFVEGQPASVALLVGREQIVTLPPATQELSDDGRFRYLGGRLPLPVELAQRAERLALDAVAGIEGLHGYVGVDLVLGGAADGSADRAIEINPRPTTSYVGLRRFVVGNLAQMWLDMDAGRPVAPPRTREGGVRFLADGSVMEC